MVKWILVIVTSTVDGAIPDEPLCTGADVAAHSVGTHTILSTAHTTIYTLINICVVCMMYSQWSFRGFSYVCNRYSMRRSTSVL